MPRRRVRNRLSNYLLLATVLLSVILPVVLLHDHRLAATLATWSLLCFGHLVYLSTGHPRILRVLGNVEHRRLFTNTAITAVVLALFAVAAFHGGRGVELAGGACALYLAGHMLYRFIKTRKQLEGMDWLLAAVFVSSVTYTLYMIALSHIVACGLPLAVATLFWIILIRRHRVLLPEFNDLPRKIRDTHARLVAPENDRPDSSPLRFV